MHEFTRNWEVGFMGETCGLMSYWIKMYVHYVNYINLWIYFRLSLHRLWYRRYSVFFVLVLFSVFTTAYSIEGAHQTVRCSYSYQRVHVFGRLVCFGCTFIPPMDSVTPETSSWTCFVPKSFIFPPFSVFISKLGSVF